MGYDRGDECAHVTTNISPERPQAPIDFFTMDQVVTLRDADSSLVWPPD